MSVAERLRAGDVEDRLAAMAELAAPDAGDAELDALASCLGHDRKIVQRRAAEAFGTLAAGGVPVRPVLERALHAPGARQRWGAAYALALIGAPPPETLPVLLEALGEDDGDLRWAAARILVRMRDDAALRPTLVDLAAAGNAPQRKMALYCLRDLEAPSSDAERAALVALRDADTAVRLVLQGDNLVLRSDFDGAIAGYTEAIRLEPQSTAAYLGRGTARTLTLLPDGSVLSDRAQQKVRSADRGLRYAVALLLDQGAEPPCSEDPQALTAWLRRWKARLCCRVRHRGNHKYAWALSRQVRLPAGLPYPKQVDP